MSEVSQEQLMHKLTVLINRVKDHPRLQQGYKTRLWCSQDEGQKKKKKPKMQENTVHRDTVGMTQYNCKSKLIVLCAARGPTGTHTVMVHLHHHKNHQLYYNVTLPSNAAALVRENLKWSTPVSITPKIQVLHLQVTAKQVHRAWTEMSETLWKRDKMQLPSAAIRKNLPF
jgi:hypothetical protein